jgi:hypothetical protein
MPTAAAIRAARGRTQNTTDKKPQNANAIAGPSKNAYASKGQYGGVSSRYAQKKGRQMYGGPIKMSGTERKVFELARQDGISIDDARARLREEQERARAQRESAKVEQLTAGMGIADKARVRELMGSGYTLDAAVAEARRPRWRW